MSDRLLELQLELLVLRHGRRGVIEALTAAAGMTIEEIETAIASTERRAKGRSAPPSPEAIARQAFAGRAGVLPTVLQLLAAYENKTFLPQLRDVQRLVQKSGVTRTRLRSRASAVGAMIKALATMDDADLRRLLVNELSTGTSDYEMLAHEIMGGAARRRNR
jgi:hypothetical protein